MIGSDQSVENQQDTGLQQSPLQGEPKDHMSEIDNGPRTYSGALLAVIAVSLLCAIGGLIWSYSLSGRMARSEAALTEANQQNARLAAGDRWAGSSRRHTTSRAWPAPLG